MRLLVVSSVFFNHERHEPGDVIEIEPGDLPVDRHGKPAIPTWARKHHGADVIAFPERAPARQKGRASGANAEAEAKVLAEAARRGISIADMAGELE